MAGTQRRPRENRMEATISRTSQMNGRARTPTRIHSDRLPPSRNSISPVVYVWMLETLSIEQGCVRNFFSPCKTP